MSREPQSILEAQQQFEKVALESLKAAIHQISVDAFSVSATRYLQIMNLDPNLIPGDSLSYLSYQQMIWEDMNKVKSMFFGILSDLGNTAPTANSPVDEKEDFASYCEQTGFIRDLSKVMERLGQYPETPPDMSAETNMQIKSIVQYINLRDAQLFGMKNQFLGDVGNRWNILPDTLEKFPYQTYQDLMTIQDSAGKPPDQVDIHRNQIQKLLEFPKGWQQLLANVPKEVLMHLEQIIITGTLGDTANELLIIANDSKKVVPDFPLFKTYLRLFNKPVEGDERSEEQTYFEDFLYAIWKEAFINTIVTLRDVGLEAAQEVWAQMYEGLDVNTEMLLKSAEETQLFVQLEELESNKMSLDDIRNQFMEQFLRDEIPGVVKAVRGFLKTLQKEDAEPTRIEMARAFRMTESSVNGLRQGQLKEISRIVADGLEASTADFTWIRANAQDIESALLVIESLRKVALEDEVLTLEKIEQIDRVQNTWKAHGIALNAGNANVSKPSAAPKELNFKDDSGFDFFGDLTDSLGDDLGNLDFGSLDKDA